MPVWMTDTIEASLPTISEASTLHLAARDVSSRDKGLQIDGDPVPIMV